MNQHHINIQSIKLLILLSVLLFGVVLLVATLEKAVFSTILFYIFVTITGYWFAQKTLMQLEDRKLSILGLFWLVKVFVTLLLLYLGWMPMLDPSSVGWGYDPQRYYLYAQQLLENNWDLYLIETKYYGIIYYYAGIIFIFGANPVVPALANAFVTLLGTLFIIRTAYASVPNLTYKSHYIAWLILIPEVLWFDVMTSRETLMAILLATSLLGFGSLIGSLKSKKLFLLMIIVFANAGILAIRPSMISGVALSFFLMILIIRNHRKSGFLLALLALIILALGLDPVIEFTLDSYEINLQRIFLSIYNFEENIASRVEWSENSIGLLLAPNDLFEVFLFLPPRMLLYLAAPLPKVGVSLGGLVGGNLNDWQSLMVIPTSVLMLLGFPYVLAGTAHAWRYRRELPSLTIIPIAFWITYVTVVGGNFIIHERYRVMFTLLLFAVMWIGFSQSRVSSVKKSAIFWYGILCASAIFYIFFKFI